MSETLPSGSLHVRLWLRTSHSTARVAEDFERGCEKIMSEKDQFGFGVIPPVWTDDPTKEAPTYSSSLRVKPSAVPLKDVLGAAAENLGYRAERLIEANRFDMESVDIMITVQIKTGNHI